MSEVKAYEPLPGMDGSILLAQLPVHRLDITATLEALTPSRICAGDLWWLRCSQS